MKDANDNTLSMQALVDRSYAKMIEEYDSEREVKGISWGLNSLNELTDRLAPSTLNLITARRSMGKTAFILNLAYSIGVRQKRSVAYFMHRESSTTIVQRMLKHATSISSRLFQMKRLRDGHWRYLHDEALRIKESSIFFNDCCKKFDDLADQCRLLKDTENGLDALLIDDLPDLIVSDSESAGDTAQLHMSERLKALARELQIAIVATSQLPLKQHSCYGESSKKILSLDEDLFAPSVDVILNIEREAFYNPEAKRKNLAQFTLCRNTDGLTDTCELEFDSQTYTFWCYQDN